MNVIHSHTPYSCSVRGCLASTLTSNTTLHNSHVCTDLCRVASEAQILFVCLHTLPDACLNGSRYFPFSGVLLRSHGSSRYVVHTSCLSLSSFTWLSAVYYLTEHKLHQNNSKVYSLRPACLSPVCVLYDRAEVCNADLPLSFGLHIGANIHRPHL